MLLATDSSVDAIESVRIFANLIEMSCVRRIHLLAIAWPVNFCEPVPPIGEHELERLDRVLHVLTASHALIEVERASDTSARCVLAAADGMHASMIVLALSAEDRTNELATKLVDSSPLPVIRLHSRHSA